MRSIDVKCSRKAVPCFFLAEQDLWLIFTHSISFGVSPSGENRPSLTSDPAVALPPVD